MPGNPAAHASPPLSGTVTGTPPLPSLPLFLHRIIKNQYQKLICSNIATSSDIHEAQPTLCGMTGRGRGRREGNWGSWLHDSARSLFGHVRL